MEAPLKTSLFSKSLLSGLLTGIIAAVLNLIYSIIFRGTTSFATAEIIMPFPIFIGFPILLVLAGYVFYLLQKHLITGTSWFILFFIPLMATLILTTVLDTRHNGGAFLSSLGGLCFGTEIITCLFAALLTPYFARNPKIYV